MTPASTPKELIAKAEQFLSDGDFIQSVNPADAVTAYLSAAELYRRAEDPAAAARILNQNIGHLYYQTGDYREALRWWKQALGAYEALGDENGQCDVLNKLGVVYKITADYSTALEYYQKGLRLARHLGNNPVTVKLLNNIGLINKRLGRPRQAIEKFTESLAFKRRSGDQAGVANTLNNLGNVYKFMGRHEEALAALEESREIFSALEADAPGEEKLQFGLAAVTHDIGNIHFKCGDYAKALAFYQDCLNINRQGGKLMSLFADYRDIGEIYIRQHKYDSAENFLLQAQKIADRAGMEDCLYMIHDSLGQLQLAREDRPGALEHFTSAIRILETIRGKLIYESHQTGFMKGVLGIYLSTILVLIQIDQKAEAFRYLEMMKARALLDVLEGDQSDFRDLLTEHDAMKEKEILEKLEKLNNEIAGLRSFQQSEFSIYTQMREQAREELHAFEEALYVSNPVLKELRGRGETLTFRKARNLMSRDEMAVYYLLAGAELIIFLLTRRDLEIKVLPVSEMELRASVQALQNPTTQWDHEAARDLYTTLIAPVIPYTNEVKRLCIIPDGVLNSIPFQALEDPKTERYLIEDFAVYYAPSLSALKSVRSIGNYGTSSLLAFGDPGSKPAQGTQGNTDLGKNRVSLNRVPATKDEVAALESVYAPGVKILTGAEATKSNFMKYAGDYGVLHFATHAFADEQNPMYSAIVLAGESGDYSFLEAREIIKMELNADLVVLSACKTAAGKVVAGEGILGLTRAFFTAGVPTVVSSLWNVDDRSTRELMIQFHTRFRNRERPATALREAQLFLLRETEFSNPFFWAPFVLIGDSE